MKLQKDLREFIELLDSAKVKYLIVGGHAVAYHGFPRFTGSMDFFMDRSAENAAALASVLRTFGFSALAADAEDLMRPGMVIQLGRPPNRIDLLTSIDGVEFADAWPKRDSAQIDGVPVSILSKDLLLQNKRATGRPRDLEDVRRIQ